jgi:membrane-bound lytic murein transglycosylase MltF
MSRHSRQPSLGRPFLVLAALLAAGACSRPEEAPAPGEPATELTAEQAAEALGGVPYLSDQEGPSLIVPDEFTDMWETWTGDLDGIVQRRLLRVLVSYNSTNYYVDRGQQGGIAYEMFRLLEKELNRRFATGALPIDVLFIPVTRDRLLPALIDGHGDIAAASLTVTDARRQVVDFSAPLARGVREVVVSGPGAAPLGRIEDLAGDDVFVRVSSSYAESLAGLSAGFRERGLDPVEVVPVDERLETEDILEMVSAGVFSYTVADDYLARLWAQVLEGIEIHPELAIAENRDIAWALRKASPQLKGFVDEFLRTHRAGTLTGNVILNRYLESPRRIRNPGSETDVERFRSMVGLFQKYGDRYGFNWLLLAAQAYQESRLDQSMRSPAGAVGVMQLLPSTARDPNVNIHDITALENNIHAGAKYLRFILDRYFEDADMDDVDRHLFAFASYNAGPARVAGLRREAAAIGLDPNQWRDNVEVVAAREVGREPVQYVANILKYYFAYRLVVERSLGQSAARRAATG